jgi:hypothetical protein
MMRPATALKTFHKESGVAPRMLVPVLTAHGQRHGWDTARVSRAVEGVGRAHSRYGHLLAVQYPESLV